MSYAVTKYFTPARIEAAKQSCRAAIGRHCKVRQADGVQHGTIVACDVHASVQPVGRTKVQMLFDVTMECGVNKTVKSFTLLSIPTGA